MTIFQSAQKYFGIVGISSHNVFQKLNTKSVGTFIIFGQALISNYVFLLHEAGSFREYTDSFYATATVTLGAINFSIAVWKMAETFKFIENCEDIIGKSKSRISMYIQRLMQPSFVGLENPSSRAIYEEIVRQIEKMCEALNFIIIYISTPCVMLPKCMLSFFAYFTTDLGSGAFELPFNVW